MFWNETKHVFKYDQTHVLIFIKIICAISSIHLGVRCCESVSPVGEWYYPLPVNKEKLNTFPKPNWDGGLYILYLHGGAFCLCNTATHRGILYRLVDSTGACIFAVGYRRPPGKYLLPIIDSSISFVPSLHNLILHRSLF